MKRKYYHLLSCLAIALVVLSILGCADEKKQKAKPSPQLYLAVAYDVSGSAGKNGIPVMQASHLDRLISIMEKHGGVLAFGLIGSNGFSQNLYRLELKPMAGRLDERAQAKLKSKDSIAEFKAKVEPMLNDRSNKITDFNGAILRFSLFLGEPIPHEKVLVVISDGIDTGKSRRQPISLPEGVKSYTVGMDKNVAMKIFGDKVVLFESIDSALDML